ncbi:MAG: 4-hydroxythreonine-4-phosphate dehydrogenase PdxA [Burkholderiaceae bacterium]|nr:4-hydroxythreonine-4-phosphate dehydrogenase PdxA [Burkholderiaceae bacterium]
MKPIALTTGEPSGIGPEISVKSVYEISTPVCLVGDRLFLNDERIRLGLPDWPAHVSFEHISLESPVTYGQLDVSNARYVLKTLQAAATGAMNGRFSAVATAPVQKSIINDAGIAFTGHTEFFADIAQVPKVVMMLVSSEKSDALRVALVTTHLPIAKLAAAITDEALDETINILYNDLHQHFGIDRPRIAITGLNPHAGEGGHMGDEEIRVIAPAINRAQASGIDASGPYPADTVFVADRLKNFDAILCMYHDQGLPVLKHASFGHGVNVTLGLPFIRTSVDHGTALDIAGKNIANIGSLLTAIKLAKTLAENKYHG